MAVGEGASGMRIEKLYLYPIKSFREVSLDTTTLTKYGFNFDRIFMVLQVNDENGEKTFKNMTVANFNEMVRFYQNINIPDDGEASEGTLEVTFKPINDGEPKKIEIPLVPDTSSLEVIDVMMHKSPTQAYKMDDKYNEWLSSCFGYECVLAYIGDNTRDVRFSMQDYKASVNGAANGWLGSISSLTNRAAQMVTGYEVEKPLGIKFSDVAPYLIVSSKSMEDVHDRLPEGEKFDITKFRPNVIVSGADEPWEEDYWGELTVDGGAKFLCEHNCGRCKSINIDYNTGAQGTDEAGKMLKKLSTNRRVDPGYKYGPSFGRYSFLHPNSEGEEVHVGQEVVVTRYNKERTAFDWAGLHTIGK